MAKFFNRNVININEDINIDRSREVTGAQPKVWGTRISDGKTVLIKYNSQLRDMDSGQRYWYNYAEREFCSSKIFEFFGVPCQKVYYGIDDKRCMEQKKCVVVESILQEHEELIGLKLENFDWDSGDSCIKRFIESYLNLVQLKIGNERIDWEQIKKDLIRVIFMKCLISNSDWQSNIGIIYNSQSGTYRFAPSFDNGCAFDYDYEWFSRSKKIIHELIEEYFEDIEDLISKILESDITKLAGRNKSFKIILKQQIEVILRKYRSYVNDKNTKIKSL